MNSIVKNAVVLYGRLFITMALSLYASRLVLKALGIEDFGIYNVVGSIVTMFSFINNAMAFTTQRFVSFELGRKKSGNVSSVFSMSVNIHIIMGIVILLIAYVVGAWFINNKLSLPYDRLDSAIIVFNISLITFFFNFISTPYYGAMIAFEKFTVIAWIGIAESFLRLFVVIILFYSEGVDLLVFYSILYAIITILSKISQVLYCHYNIKPVKYIFEWSWEISKNICSFSSWSLIGNIAAILMNQGVNILLNIFFGPTINAARAISMQVQTAVNQFATSLQMVFNPKIIKSYSSDDLGDMRQIVYYGSKYSYFMMLILSMPIIFNTDYILTLWLGNYPEKSDVFVQLMLINLMINSISSTLITSVSATGRIALYQSVVGGILLLNIPISYLLLKSGIQPEITIVVTISLSLITLIARLFFAEKIIGSMVKDFMIIVILRVFLVTTLSCAVLFKINFSATSYYQLLINLIISISIVLLSIIILGMGKVEIFYIRNKLTKILSDK